MHPYTCIVGAGDSDMLTIYNGHHYECLIIIHDGVIHTPEIVIPPFTLCRMKNGVATILTRDMLATYLKGQEAVLVRVSLDNNRVARYALRELGYHDQGIQ